MASTHTHRLDTADTPATVHLVPAVKLPSSVLPVGTHEMLARPSLPQSAIRPLLFDSRSPSAEAECDEGVAEYAARKLRSALKDCKRMRKELAAAARPTQSCGPILSSDAACPICSNVYDCGLTLPLCLPCGHSLCSSCALKLARRSTILCPFDRQPIDTDSSSLPVNLALVQLAGLELASAQCQTHESQVVGYCVTTGELLCGFCDHDSGHKHILLDSAEASVLVQEQTIALSQRLVEAWLAGKQISNYSLEVESLMLRLTVKFNGFSLMHRSTKREKRLSKRFADALLRLRSELECVQRLLQSYLRTQSCVYWNAGSIENWQWLVWRIPQLPRVAKVAQAVEAMQKWLKEDQ